MFPTHFQNAEQQQHNQSSSSSESQSSEQNIDASSRPRIQVAPKGIGPVTDLHENDVLCGRGGRINGHCGNIQFRKFCAEKRDEYFTKGIKKIHKAHIAASVVERIRSLSPPGRFLKYDTSKGQWFDIGCAKAATKVGQAIREHTPKEETFTGGMANSSMGQQRETSLLGFNGPLYPGYQPIETPSVQSHQVAQETINSPQTPPPTYFQTPACNSDNLFAPVNHSTANAAPTVSYRAEKRLSALSAMSGLSRMSALMRASVQSDFSESTTSPMSTSTNRRISRADSLLRQSVLSDISSMSLEGDDGDWPSTAVADDSLAMQQDMDMRLPGNQPIGGDDRVAVPSRMEFPSNLLPRTRMVSDATDANLKKVAPEQQQQQQQGRWAGLGGRHLRKNSLLSMSMVSTVSLLSIGSATSFF